MSIYEYGVATGRLGSLDNARTPYKTTEQIAFQSPIRNHPAVNPTQLRVRKPYHLWGLVPRYGKVSHYLVSTVFVIRGRTVMSWLSESHVLGHSHFIVGSFYRLLTLNRPTRVHLCRNGLQTYSQICL